MRFNDYHQASAWRRNNDGMLQAITAEVARVAGVSYTENWLCGECPSFVAGFNDEDTMIVCLPIRSHLRTMA